MKTLLLVLVGSLACTASDPLDNYNHLAGELPDYDLQATDYTSSGLADQLAEKRGAGKWKMRMFKRDPGLHVEEDIGLDQDIPEDFYDEDLDMVKRGRQWKMRMFKKKDPWKMRMFKKGGDWKMRMFKRYPYMLQTEMDKKSPWKMRMFKRLSSYGKRPDKWQMRMFKRDPEQGQNMAGDSSR